MDFDIEKLHAIELEAIAEIKKICDLENINWFLIGGSALGAVRHDGFIPWDDDVDIGMFRDDYERFLSVAKTSLSDKFFLQTLETDKGYHLGYAKVRINDTLYIQENVSHRKMHHGVFVDIYPIDWVPDSKKLRKKQRLYSNLSYTLCRGEPVTKQGKAINIISTVMSKIIPKSWLKSVGIIFDKKISKFKGKYIANIYGIKQYDNEIMPREYIGIPILHKFENLTVPIPENYHEYLTFLYGDYMELPEDKQFKHFPVKYSF